MVPYLQGEVKEGVEGWGHTCQLPLLSLERLPPLRPRGRFSGARLEPVLAPTALMPIPQHLPPLHPTRPRS